MRRKDGAKAKDGQLSFLEKDQKEEPVVETEQPTSENGVFIVENGRMEPVSADCFITSTMYRTVDSFSVDCRLVKPEEPGGMVFEGKKPSKKTVPVLIGREGECVILNSWEELETEPSRLSNAIEVLGAMPVKQVFVLKRKP